MKEVDATNAVSIKDLSFYYESSDGSKIKALDHLNLQLKAGKKIAFLGANGSGKTTLFYHFNGLLLPQSGEMKVMGREVNKKSRKQLIKKVGIVFENPDNQLFSTTVYDDVAFALRNYGENENEVQKKVNSLLKKVRAEDLADKSPYNLSWGQKKRASIAATLAINPEILVFDEPFSGLDPQVSKYLLSLLDQLYNEGKTLIIGTHNVDLAYIWADEIVILAEGKVVEHGSIQILNDQELMEKVSLDTPLLAKVFKDTSYSPKSVEEARTIINNIIGVFK